MQCAEDRLLTSINFCARVNCSAEKQVVSYVTFWKDSGYHPICSMLMSRRGQHKERCKDKKVPY